MYSTGTYWYMLEMIKNNCTTCCLLYPKKFNFTGVLFRAPQHYYNRRINTSKCYNQMYLTSRNGCEIHFFKSLRPKAVVVWLMTQNKEDFSLPFVCEVETKLQWEHSTVFYHDYKGISDNFDVFKVSSVEIITKCYGVSGTIIYHNKLSNLLANWHQFYIVRSVLLLIMIHHNIVKGAVDPWGDSQLDPQTVNLSVLTHCINYKFMCLSTYWQWQLLDYVHV